MDTVADSHPLRIRALALCTASFFQKDSVHFLILVLINGIPFSIIHQSKDVHPCNDRVVVRFVGVDHTVFWYPVVYVSSVVVV